MPCVHACVCDGVGVVLQDGKGDDCDIDDDNDGKVGPLPACVAPHWWFPIAAHIVFFFLYFGLIGRGRPAQKYGPEHSASMSGACLIHGGFCGG